MFLRSLFLVLMGATVGGSVLAADFAGRSARREPGVSYHAYKSHLKALSESSRFRSATPMDEAKPFGTAVLPAATEWPSEAVMLERFKQFRDHRFVHDSSRPDFLRRSTWLYPDDGCFARASLAVLNLHKWSYEAPSKVFVFGDLQVETKNAPWGSVSWWYHVAPLVEVNGQKYVMDPSIEPKHPLKLAEWLGRMSERPEALEVAVCGSGSYTPDDICAKRTDGIERTALTDQGYFLSAEWYRLEELNRNPERELGEYPPWLDQVASLVH